MTKTAKQIEEEIAEYLKTKDRYMLVDNRTGRDMRPAQDFEVKHIQSQRYGVAILQLGGGWKSPVTAYEVRLRDTSPPRADTGPPPGLSVKSRLFYLAEIDLGKLHRDERSYRTLEEALADVKVRGWRRHNSVIVEQQQLVHAGAYYGSHKVLHSIIDGHVLDDSFVPTLNSR